MKRRSHLTAVADELRDSLVFLLAIGWFAWFGAVAVVGEPLRHGDGHRVLLACLAVVAGLLGTGAFWLAARRPKGDEWVPIVAAVTASGVLHEWWPELSWLVRGVPVLLVYGIGSLIVRLSRRAAGQGSVASSKASQPVASEATPSGNGTDSTES